MNWNQSRVGYYFDFVLVPLLMLALAATHPDVYAAAGAAAGLAAWQELEYWIHRVLFHKIFSRGHGLHHRKPRGYVAAPVWLTAIPHVALCSGALLLGSVASGLVIGLEAGYLAYIVVHDRIHHGPKNASGWIGFRQRLHDAHHHGIEANFGVVSSICDRLHGTFLALP